MWTTNRHDGSENYLISERVLILNGINLILLRKELMKNSRPLIVKGLLEISLHQKVFQVEWKVDLFNCNREEITHPANIDDQYDLEGHDEISKLQNVILPLK